MKPQSAFYEMYGQWGIAAFWETIRYARSRGLLTIADAKRGDIGSTVEAYAAAFFGHPSPLETWEDPDQWADALTVNPYLEATAWCPSCAGPGPGHRRVLLLVMEPLVGRAAGPAAVLRREPGPAGGQAGGLAGSASGGPVRLLLRGRGGRGAPTLEDPQAVPSRDCPGRSSWRRLWRPGGTAADVVGAFNADGLGAVVSASRSVIYAYRATDPSLAEAVAAIAGAAEAMNREHQRGPPGGGQAGLVGPRTVHRPPHPGSCSI